VIVKILQKGGKKWRNLKKLENTLGSLKKIVLRSDKRFGSDEAKQYGKPKEIQKQEIGQVILMSYYCLVKVGELSIARNSDS
jgi:hypothetical protein